MIRLKYLEGASNSVVPSICPLPFYKYYGHSPSYRCLSAIGAIRNNLNVLTKLLIQNLFVTTYLLNKVTMTGLNPAFVSWFGLG